ncbi:hypothetical protein MIMGU_mgv1a018721mg, partial [Erythranthe guttata]
MAGIGKSCLARLLFNHIAVANRFDCRLWVFVSTEFNPREVIKELMQPLPGDTTESLHRCLEGKRYLVVLDDEREILLFNRENASRLLLTSRNRVPRMNTPYVHEMKLLGPEKNWPLLLTKAFFEGLQVKRLHEFEIIGREILKKCSGLPLAI